MISDNIQESVAFISDPNAGTTILKKGDRYLESTLTTINPKDVIFVKNEKVITKKLNTISSKTKRSIRTGIKKASKGKKRGKRRR